MAEFSKVTKLVDDHIVHQCFREKYNFVVKVKVSMLGATSPTGPLIFY